MHAHTQSFLLCLSFSHRPRLLVEVSVRFCSAKHPVAQECLDCSGFSPKERAHGCGIFPVNSVTGGYLPQPKIVFFCNSDSTNGLQRELLLLPA